MGYQAGGDLGAQNGGSVLAAFLQGFHYTQFDGSGTLFRRRGAERHSRVLRAILT